MPLIRSPTIPRIVSTLLALITLSLTICGIWTYSANAYNPHGRVPSSTPSTMTLVHTVLFLFKEDVQPEAVKEACKHFLSLKETCIHPTANKPYILSLKGGKDNSPEGMQVCSPY